MKAIVRAPFFEIGIKNYLYGEAVLRLARAADAAAERWDIDVLMITPYTEIRAVAQNTRRLIVLAPYMDAARPGRGMANVLPEAIKAAGARGVVLNHCERPMTLEAITATMQRAAELELLTFACAGTPEEARALACLKPDIINPEPSERIGVKADCDMRFIREATAAIKGVDPGILVEQAAGITDAEQVYRLIAAGAEGVGVASGIAAAAEPETVAQVMIHSVRRALNVRGAMKGEESR